MRRAAPKDVHCIAAADCGVRSIEPVWMNVVLHDLRTRLGRCFETDMMSIDFSVGGWSGAVTMEARGCRFMSDSSELAVCDAC